MIMVEKKTKQTTIEIWSERIERVASTGKWGSFK